MPYTKSMYTAIMHSTLIIITIAFSFLFSKTPLASLDIQINAFLFILLFISRRWYRNKDKNHLVESVIFTFMVSSIINTTGGLTSPYFFLLYILLFSLSLFLEPIISITTTVALIFFYLLSVPINQSLEQLLPIFSLALITPFAMFLGEENFKERKERERSSNLKKSTFLFLSLILKNHINNIIQAAENFLGDQQLTDIKKNAKRMQKLIDEYENEK